MTDKPKRARRGRPLYVASNEDREKVRVLKASGMTNDAIAEAVGISIPTLTKHFAVDLDCGTAKVRAEVLMARWNAAKGGNVSAQNRMLDDLKARQVHEERAKVPPKLGKKEQQQIAAQQAGARFAPPAPPKLVVSN